MIMILKESVGVRRSSKRGGQERRKQQERMITRSKEYSISISIKYLGILLPGLLLGAGILRDYLLTTYYYWLPNIVQASKVQLYNNS
jgi:hypothetical protein